METTIETPGLECQELSGPLSDQMRTYIGRTGDNSRWMGADGETDRGDRESQWIERLRKNGVMK